MDRAPSRRAARDRTRAFRKGDEREQAILDSAERRLAEVGAGALTIDDVARGAGLSRPSLYFYFTSKAELIAALVARAQADVFGPVADAQTDAEATLARILRPALEHTADRWRRHGPVLRTGIELADAMPEIGEQYDAAVQRLVDAVAGLVRAEHERGLADPGADDPLPAVQALVLMTERSLQRLFARPHERADEDALVDTLEQLWRRGLGLPAP